MTRELPVLTAGQCQVWWAAPVEHDRAERLLDPAERAHAHRFRRADDRALYVAAHSLARLVLGFHAGIEPQAVRLLRRCPRCGGEHGKPRVVGPGAELEFSITHAGARVGLAVTVGVPVGIDVERVDPARAGDWLKRSALAPEEARWFARATHEDPVRVLIAWWTRKEAALKATGDGLAVAPHRIAVTPPGEPPRLVAWHAADAPLPQTMRLVDLRPGAEHVGALAMLGDDAELQEFDGSRLLAAAD